MAAATSTFVTAADAAYGYHLINLLGSLRANSDVFDQVVAYDLGVTEHQRELLDRVGDVEVRTVPAFAPHWNQCFTWKPWIWTHLGSGQHVFYLDAGATLIRSLEPALTAIGERGYFLVSQGGELEDIVPPDYFDLYDLSRDSGARSYVAAGIIGFDTTGSFYERVVVPTYADCMLGRNLGFSADEVSSKNRGLGWVAHPRIRNCSHFRWDQTLLNIHLANEVPDALVADMLQYAGVRSSREHPEQVIWAHRREGDLRYLKRIRYLGSGAWQARLFGAYWQLRWRYKLRGKFLRTETYVMKGKKLLRRASRQSTA